MASSTVKGKIGSDDINYFDGGSDDTFSRLTSTGGTLTLNKVGHEVNVAEAYGSGTVSEAALTAALAGIGTTNKRSILLKHGTWNITADCTIPSNVTLRCMPGAILTVATTKTLTINGPLEAGPYQIFSWAGTGAIDISGSPTSDCYFQWWGAVTGTGNDNAAILDKYETSTASHQTLRITKGLWRIATPVVLNRTDGFRIKGDSKDDSWIYIDVGAGNNGIVFGTDAASNSSTNLEDFSFVGPAAACLNGVIIYRTVHLRINNVQFTMGAAEYAVRFKGVISAQVKALVATMPYGAVGLARPANGYYIGTATATDTNNSQFFIDVYHDGVGAHTLCYLDAPGKNIEIGGVHEGAGTGYSLYATGLKNSTIHNFWSELSDNSYYLNDCIDIKIGTVKAWGATATLVRCRGIDINGGTYTNLIIDSDCRACSIGSNDFSAANSLQDSAPDTYYYGGLSFWTSTSLGNTSFNLWGENRKNILHNVGFTRWTAEEPDGWDDSSAANFAWSQAGTGLGDTTRHETTYCAKTVVSTAGGYSLYALNTEQIQQVQGKYINFSAWLKLAAAQAFDNYTTSAYLEIYTAGGAVNPSANSTTAFPIVVGDIGSWKKLVTTIYIPSDCTTVQVRVRQALQTGSVASTLYIAEPCLMVGRMPSRGVVYGQGETAEFIQIGGVRIWATSPAVGTWIALHDVDLSTGQRCTVAGAMGTATWANFP